MEKARNFGDTIEVGQTWRMIGKFPSAWSDCYIDRIEKNVVYLLRPYLLEDGFGCEKFSVFIESLRNPTRFEFVRESNRQYMARRLAGVSEYETP